MNLPKETSPDSISSEELLSISSSPKDDMRKQFILLYSSGNNADSNLKTYSVKLGSISPKRNLLSKYYCVGYVDACNEESFTLETFEAMISASHQQDKHFILARVTTCDPSDSNKLYYSFYYAPQLNRVLFRTEGATGNRPAFLHRMHSKNPLNNMPIIGDVEYFIISPEDVNIARNANQKDIEDGSYLQASLLDLESYLGSDLNPSCPQLTTQGSENLILYRAHYLASDDDFLRIQELRAFFMQNAISEDISFFEIHPATNGGINLFPFERYGINSDGIILNPERYVIDMSTVNENRTGLFCGSYFRKKSAKFRRNFFLCLLIAYLCFSFTLIIFLIPDNLKGIIGVSLVIGLCALLIIYIENDRIFQANTLPNTLYPARTRSREIERTNEVNDRRVGAQHAFEHNEPLLSSVEFSRPPIPVVPAIL